MNTSRLTDIWEGPDSSYVQNLIAHNDELYFSAVKYKYLDGDIILKRDLYMFNHSTDTLNVLPVANLHQYGIFDIFVIDGDVYLTAISKDGMEIFAYGNAVVFDEERIQ